MDKKHQAKAIRLRPARNDCRKSGIEFPRAVHDQVNLFIPQLNTVDAELIQRYITQVKMLQKSRRENNPKPTVFGRWSASLRVKTNTGQAGECKMRCYSSNVIAQGCVVHST